MADADNGGAAPAASSGVPSRASPAKRRLPTKPVPTDRIAFPKQFDILRAYAAASGQARKAVSNEEVAALVKMNASTVSLANPLFAEIGLLVRQDGKYVPSDEVFEFQRAYSWNPESAAHKLAPRFHGAWFWEAIKSHLEFGSIPHGQALGLLADASEADPSYRSRLTMLLEYLRAVGLVSLANGVVTRSGEDIPVSEPLMDNAEDNTKKALHKPIPATRIPTVAPSREGRLQFNISLDISMAELSSWPADRISAFFGGVAQVLAAKAGVQSEDAD